MQLVNDTRSEARSPARLDPFLRLPAVEATTGLKKSTIYLLMKRGEFPRCVQITSHCVAWRNSHVERWMQDRIAAGGKQSDAPVDSAAQGDAQ